MACLAQARIKQYTGASTAVTAACPAGNLPVRVLAVITRRAIGLFYRHDGYVKW